MDLLESLCCAGFRGELDVPGGRVQQVVVASSVRILSSHEFKADSESCCNPEVTLF